MNTMTRKGYGRIYVLDPAHVETVKNIIRELDEFEFEYLPSDMVAPFSEYPKVVYTHKFDALDLDAFTATCLSRGIVVWAFDSGHYEYPASGIKTTAETIKP